MNIDRTDPKIVRNYLTFPYAVKPTNWQQTAAKVAAIFAHVLLSLATVSIFALITTMQYLNALGAKKVVKNIDPRVSDPSLSETERKALLVKAVQNKESISFFNHSKACMDVVDICRFGYINESEVLEIDIERAVILLEYLKNEGWAEARKILASIYINKEAICDDVEKLFNLANESQDYKEKYWLMEIAVENGHVGAMSELGRLVYYGNPSEGIKKNINMAISLFKKAEHDVQACKYLAEIYLFGVENEIEVDAEQGAYYLLLAFDNGGKNLSLCEKLRYSTLSRVILNKQAALDFLNQRNDLDKDIIQKFATKKGRAAERVLLQKKNQEWPNSSKDPVDFSASCVKFVPIQHFEGAYQPLPRKIRQIDVILDNINRAVLRNESNPDQVQFNRECLKAVKIYRQGFDEESGDVVEKNIDKAMAILKYLEVHGCYATYILADIYANEEAFCDDQEKLFNLANDTFNEKLMDKLVEKGHVGAISATGKAYYEGHRVGGKNIDEAVRQFDRAAKLGNVEACQYLTKIYLCGEDENIPLDVNKGARYFLLAFNNGDSEIMVTQKSGWGTSYSYYNNKKGALKYLIQRGDVDKAIIQEFATKWNLNVNN